jgi:hypothetical protein
MQSFRQVPVLIPVRIGAVRYNQAEASLEGFSEMSVARCESAGFAAEIRCLS